MGRPGAFPKGIAAWSATLVVAVGCAASSHAGQPQPAARDGATAQALFCAYGSVGLRPSPLPPDYELHFAVAVVEIRSPRRITDAKVTAFSLFDGNENVTTFKRVVAIEEFNRSRTVSEGSFAYYLNPGGTRPWDGTLPAGTIRLRVRVAMAEAPTDLPVRFRMSLGPFVVQGPVDGEWLTG